MCGSARRLRPRAGRPAAAEKRVHRRRQERWRRAPSATASATRREPTPLSQRDERRGESGARRRRDHDRPSGRLRRYVSGSQKYGAQRAGEIEPGQAAAGHERHHEDQPRRPAIDEPRQRHGAATPGSTRRASIRRKMSSAEQRPCHRTEKRVVVLVRAREGEQGREEQRLHHDFRVRIAAEPDARSHGARAGARPRTPPAGPTSRAPTKYTASRPKAAQHTTVQGAPLSPCDVDIRSRSMPGTSAGTVRSTATAVRIEQEEPHEPRAVVCSGAGCGGKNRSRTRPAPPPRRASRIDQTCRCCAIWMPSLMYTPGSLPPMMYSDGGRNRQSADRERSPAAAAPIRDRACRAAVGEPAAPTRASAITMRTRADRDQQT